MYLKTSNINSPIDVNMPILKGMLLLWKPTGPEKISQQYIIKKKQKPR